MANATDPVEPPERKPTTQLWKRVSVAVVSTIAVLIATGFWRLYTDYSRMQEQVDHLENHIEKMQGEIRDRYTSVEAKRDHQWLLDYVARERHQLPKARGELTTVNDQIQSVLTLHKAKAILLKMEQLAERFEKLHPKAKKSS